MQNLTTLVRYAVVFLNGDGTEQPYVEGAPTLQAAEALGYTWLAEAFMEGDPGATFEVVTPDRLGTLAGYHWLDMVF